MPGTPSKTATEIIANKITLTSDDWLELIEARRQKILPLFHDSSLATLGELPWPKKKGYEQFTFSGHAKQLSGFHDELKRQGLFFFSALAGRDRGHDASDVIGQKIVWGITRDGQWVIADISYRIVWPGSSYDREHIRWFSLYQLTLQEMLNTAKIPAVLVWTELGNEITRVAGKRQRLAEAVQELSHQVRIEDRILANTIQADPALTSYLERLQTK